MRRKEKLLLKRGKEPLMKEGKIMMRKIIMKMLLRRMMMYRERVTV